MQVEKNIHIIEAHAEGEVGDVVVGGVIPPPGETLWEQSRYLARDRRLKDFLLNEPRGGVFRHVNILVPPKDNRADLAAIIMEPETVPPMSGSNTICIVTVALETGVVPMQEPETKVTLEVPGGLIDITAQCADGKVQSVTFDNVPSYVDQLGKKLIVPGIGDLTVDIAFGGDSFVVVQASDLGLELVPEQAAALTKAGMAVAVAAQEQLGFSHPELPGFDEVTFCLIAGPVIDEPVIGGAPLRSSIHAVAIKPGKLDRSPTGTGASARIALMHAKGKARPGDVFEFRSVLGSKFVAKFVSQTQIADQPAIIPRITGRAWVTGRRELITNNGDPWPTGYRLSDTWPLMPKG